AGYADGEVISGMKVEDLTVTGTFTYDTLQDPNDFTVDNDLTVGNDAAVAADLTVGGDAAVGGDFSAAGDSDDPLIATVAADDKIGFCRATPVTRPGSWAITNFTEDKEFAGDSSTAADAVKGLASLVNDLISLGIIDGTVTPPS